MTEPGSYLEWRPPERPEWVRRINEEGACMDIQGVVPLDEDSLIKAAVRATGLSDFGTTEWLEPFRVFIKALEDESNLTLMGRLRLRQEMLIYLQARLQIVDTYKRHPEIAQEEVRQPIIIVGQGRSGTSFLQNVLAAHPDYGTLRHWEMLFPCPPPEKASYMTDPRIERADRWIKQWNRVVPTLEASHEFAAHMPFECTVLMSTSFLSDAWLSGFAQVPSFHAYFATMDPVIPNLYHRRVLKLLQWKNPRTHWVLKECVHLGKLEALFKVYPDACVVWPHRDPVRANASLVNMLGTMQWSCSDTPLRPGTLEYIRNPIYQAKTFDHVIDLLESGRVPRGQIFNLKYRDLVQDPIGTIDAMHRYFDIPLSDSGRAAMVRYLKDNPRDARPPHRYSSYTGPALERVREVYKRYQDYFGISDE